MKDRDHESLSQKYNHFIPSSRFDRFPSAQVTKENVETEEHQENLDTKVRRAPGASRVQKVPKVRQVLLENPVISSIPLSPWAVANPSTAWTRTRRWCLTRSSSTPKVTLTCSRGSSSATWPGSTSSTSTSTPGTSKRPTCTSCATTASRPSCTPSPVSAPSCRARACCWSCSWTTKCGCDCTRESGRMLFTATTQMFISLSTAISSRPPRRNSFNR